MDLPPSRSSFSGSSPISGLRRRLRAPTASRKRRKRILLRVSVAEEDRQATADSVERLMGNKPEARFAFIQERAQFASAETLDI